MKGRVLVCGGLGRGSIYTSWLPSIRYDRELEIDLYACTCVKLLDVVAPKPVWTSSPDLFGIDPPLLFYQDGLACRYGAPAADGRDIEKMKAPAGADRLRISSSHAAFFQIQEQLLSGSIYLQKSRGVPTSMYFSWNLTLRPIITLPITHTVLRVLLLQQALASEEDFHTR